MVTDIYTMKASDGTISFRMTYCLPTMQALACFVEQEKGNFDTQHYPETVPGARRSAVPGVDAVYCDLPEKDLIVAAYGREGGRV